MHSDHHDHHRHPSKGASCVPGSATGYALRQSRNAGFSSCLSRFLNLNVARHTGLRISEALALDDGDIDTEAGVLRIRRGKLGKERLLPLDPSVLTQLIAYATERDRLLGCAAPAFFVTEKGTRLTDCGARYNFAHVCQRIGLRPRQQYCRHGRGPRIHDLRHSFAVRTMIGWYRAGNDPTREMIRLTTYLGHTNPSNTFWYLEAVPELLDLAMARATSGPEAVR